MSCANVVTVVFLGIIGLLALLLILLALPKSRLRYFLLEVGGWGTAGVSTVLFISPIDFVPFVPIDDPLYAIGAIAGTIMGYINHKERLRLES